MNTPFALPMPGARPARPQRVVKDAFLTLAVVKDAFLAWPPAPRLRLAVSAWG
ncbi:hypothetical protein [Actinophytocola sp.]|uniref:hypothetical protein n=1 Tax=Actinophytocola sp. TaxID=1872138 RepID=UPI002ED0709E